MVNNLFADIPKELLETLLAAQASRLIAAIGSSGLRAAHKLATLRLSDGIAKPARSC